MINDQTLKLIIFVQVIDFIQCSQWRFEQTNRCLISEICMYIYSFKLRWYYSLWDRHSAILHERTLKYRNYTIPNELQSKSTCRWSRIFVISESEIRNTFRRSIRLFASILWWIRDDMYSITLLLFHCTEYNCDSIDIAFLRHRKIIWSIVYVIEQLRLMYLVFVRGIRTDRRTIRSR